MPVTLPAPLRDTDAGRGSGLGDLPEWDLGDLYAGPEAPELGRDLDWLDAACQAFAAEYDLPIPVLDRLAEPFVRKYNERELETTLRNLKTRLETGSDGPVG